MTTAEQNFLEQESIGERSLSVMKMKKDTSYASSCLKQRKNTVDVHSMQRNKTTPVSSSQMNRKVLSNINTPEKSAFESKNMSKNYT